MNIETPQNQEYEPNEEKRKEFIAKFLKEMTLDGKSESVAKDDIAVVLEGPNAHMGMKVVYIEENGTVHLRPSPDTKEVVQHPMKDVFGLTDYTFAHSFAFKIYPPKDGSGPEFLEIDTDKVRPAEKDIQNEEKRYLNIKENINKDISNITTGDLNYFLDNIDEDDYRLAAKAYNEIKGRGKN